MKLKTIFIGSLLLLIIFLIYLTTLDKLVYFLALGDSIASGKTPYGYHDNSYNDYILKYLENKNILEKYVKFTNDNYRRTDLIQDIKNNKKILINNKEQSIKNALIKADLVTLSIGMNDLYYNLNTIDLNYDDLFKTIDEILLDIENLFELLKKYCKEDIFILSYYNSTNYNLEKHINYLNKSLSNLCLKYKIHYIQIDVNKLDKLNEKNFLINRNGQKYIGNLIINKLQNTLFKS